MSVLVGTLVCSVLVSPVLSARSLIIGSDPSVVATCGSTIHGPSGGGPLVLGSTGSLTVHPDQDGRMVELTVDVLSLGSGDALQIHGGWVQGEVVWNADVFGAAGDVVVASGSGSGALTVVFEDASGGSADFEISATCVDEGPVRIGDDRFHHTWGIEFSDSGGPDGPYQPNENLRTSFYSPDWMQMEFVLVDVEASDELAMSTFGGTFQQTIAGALPVVQAGGFQFDFTSNGSLENGGWKGFPRTLRPLIHLPATTVPVGERLRVTHPGLPTSPYSHNLYVEQGLAGPSTDLDLFLFVRPFLGSGDTLEIFAGTSAAAPLIETVSLGSPQMFIGQPGSPDLFLRFQSDGSDAGAWDAMVASMAAMHSNRTVTMCDREVVDSGALEGDYGPNENVTLTIHPHNPAAWVELEFGFFETEAGWDTLTVHDGDSTGAPVLGVFSGFSLPPTVASTQGPGGALTLRFESDGTNQYDGFLAYSTCRTALFADGFESGDLTAW